MTRQLWQTETNTIQLQLNHWMNLITVNSSSQNQKFSAAAEGTPIALQFSRQHWNWWLKVTHISTFCRSEANHQKTLADLDNQVFERVTLSEAHENQHLTFAIIVLINCKAVTTTNKTSYWLIGQLQAEKIWVSKTYSLSYELASVVLFQKGRPVAWVDRLWPTRPTPTAASDINIERRP